MLPSFQSVPGAPNPGEPILMSDGRRLRTALTAPFHPSDVEWKPGGGGDGDKPQKQAFPYIKADAIRARLDDVCGIGGWQGVPYEIGPGQTGYVLAIWIRGQWIQRGDGAFTGDIDVDHLDPKDKSAAAKKADAMSKDAKGAISNALKRAAIAWGMGEYLRDLGRIWEDVETRGYSKVFTKGAQDRLRKLAEAPYIKHHEVEAARHEVEARAALAKSDLEVALDAAKEAFRVRREVLGAEHPKTKATVALGETIAARLKAQEAKPVVVAAPSSQPSASTTPSDAAVGAPALPVAAPTPEPATPAATAATTGPATSGDQGATFPRPPGEPDVRLTLYIDALKHATDASEVKAIAATSTEDPDFADGVPRRATLKAGIIEAMRRLVPGWTPEKKKAGDAAKKRAGDGAPAPAAANH